jgi:hypothetical protein
VSMSWQQSEPKPALLVHPPDAVSLDEAHAAIELWEYYSKKSLDSAQKLTVELMMAEGSDGHWAARTTGRAEPRQNGKGDEIEVVEAWGLIQRGEWIVHTAHEIPTAKSAHRRLVGFLEGHKDLRRLIKQVRYANGDQSIEMVSGAIVVYRTRTAGGGRGLDDISRIVIDEAQHAQPEQLASSLPILAANPNPQTNFVGTGGIERVSDWWWSIRYRALEGQTSDVGEFAYIEHSAESVELNRDGFVVSTPPLSEDREAWARANPALGTRIEESFLAEQHRTLGPSLFLREHGCVWDPYPNAEGGFLPVEEWERLKVEDPSNLASVSFGLAATADIAALASAGRLPNGDLYIDTILPPPGKSWTLEEILKWAKRKKKPLRVNPSAPEGAFIRPLREAGVEVAEVTARQYQQSCAEILDTIKNGTIHHLGQSELSRAVRSAQRRDVGKDGAWVWADPAVDLTSLKAATLALSGVSANRPPRIYAFTLEEVS